MTKKRQEFLFNMKQRKNRGQWFVYLAAVDACSLQHLVHPMYS